MKTTDPYRNIVLGTIVVVLLMALSKKYDIPPRKSPAPTTTTQDARSAYDGEGSDNDLLPPYFGPDSDPASEDVPYEEPLSTPRYITYEGLISQGIPRKGSSPLWTWVWQYSGNPVDTLAHVHVLDAEDHSAEDFKTVMEKGSFPVAYISCSFEDWRSDASDWAAADKGKKMSGWDERWPSATSIKDHHSNLWSVYEGRVRRLAEKLAPITAPDPTTRRCGIEWDNVDLYDSIDLGTTEGVRFLKRLKQLTEHYGFIFVLKNSVEVIDLLPNVEMYINEQGQQYNEIQAYAEVGKKVPVLNVEYRKKPKSSPPYVFTLFYTNTGNINGVAEVIE